jgi:hypothetical protein
VIERDAVHLARVAGGPLLPGEAADSELPDDAEHWAAVYEELTGFLVQVDPPADAVERYRRRLEHWRCRRDELGGAAGTIESPIMGG